VQWKVGQIALKVQIELQRIATPMLAQLTISDGSGGRACGMFLQTKSHCLKRSRKKRALLITSRCRHHPHWVISECQKCSHPFAHRFEPLAIRLADVFWIFSRGVPLICQWHFNCLTLSVRAIKKIRGGLLVEAVFVIS
jgi:hypothetical protein